MNAHCLQWDGALLEHLQLSQLALGTVVPLGDPYLPAAASGSACCGTAIPLLWFLCLLCVSGPIILRRSLYRATANYDMGYPLYCENELAPGDPVDFKISPFGGKRPSKFSMLEGPPLLAAPPTSPKSKTISTPSSFLKLHELTCPILTCTRTCTERLDGPNVLLVYTGIC